MMLLAAFHVLVALLCGSIGCKGIEKSSFPTPKTKITIVSEHVDHFENYTKSLPSFTSNLRIREIDVISNHSTTPTSTKPQNNETSYSLEVNGRHTSTDLEKTMTADHAQTTSSLESTLNSISNDTGKTKTNRTRKDIVNVTKDGASGTVGSYTDVIPKNIPRIMKLGRANTRAIERNNSNTVKRSLWNFIKDTVSKVIVPPKNGSVVKSTNHSIVNDILAGASAILKGKISKPNVLSNITSKLGAGETKTSTVGSKNGTSFWKSISQSISNIIKPAGNCSMMNMDKITYSPMNTIVDRTTCILKNNPARSKILNIITRTLGIVNAKSSVMRGNYDRTNITSFWKSIMNSYSKAIATTWNEMAGMNRNMQNVIVGGASDILKDNSLKASHFNKTLTSSGEVTNALDAASELRLAHIRTTIYSFLKDNFSSTSTKRGNINSSKNIMVNQIVDGVADFMKFNITEINLFRSYVESLVDSVPDFDAYDPVQFAANKHKIVKLIVQGISDIVQIDIVESVLFTTYLESLVDKIPEQFDDKTMKRGFTGILTDGSQAGDFGSLATPHASMLKMNYCDSINGSEGANCTTRPTGPAFTQTTPYYVFVCIGFFLAFCSLVALGFRILRAYLGYLGYLSSD